MKAQQRQEGTVTAESESADDQACYTLAKALGELPRLVDSRPVRCVAVAPEGKVRVHVWIDHLRAEMQGKDGAPYSCFPSSRQIANSPVRPFVQRDHDPFRPCRRPDAKHECMNPTYIVSMSTITMRDSGPESALPPKDNHGGEPATLKGEGFNLKSPVTLTGEFQLPQPVEPLVHVKCRFCMSKCTSLDRTRVVAQFRALAKLRSNALYKSILSGEMPSQFSLSLMAPSIHNQYLVSDSRKLVDHHDHDKSSSELFSALGALDRRKKHFDRRALPFPILQELSLGRNVSIANLGVFYSCSAALQLHAGASGSRWPDPGNMYSCDSNQSALKDGPVSSDTAGGHEGPPRQAGFKLSEKILKDHKEIHWEGPAADLGPITKAKFEKIADSIGMPKAKAEDVLQALVREMTAMLPLYPEISIEFAGIGHLKVRKHVARASVFDAASG
ncbi:unnamed protein product [Polarella glacialis]|uniref:Uncharacterized protein n=1 Tax=Polarella glacialis TaxID=89957 RepID=A0A813GXA7_POLGL|nr:unnamed protein product [Polarella glacialis]